VTVTLIFPPFLCALSLSAARENILNIHVKFWISNSNKLDWHSLLALLCSSFSLCFATSLLLPKLRNYQYMLLYGFHLYFGAYFDRCHFPL
jgi:hypothetical protein